MILCCGEAVIDMLPRPLEEGGEGYKPVAGGALFNVALALGRLGEASGHFSNLSTDVFGDFLVEALSASNTNTELCPRSNHPTTLAFVKLTNGQAQYSFFDENSAGQNLQEDVLPELDDSVDALCFGGISLIPSQCGTAYEALMKQNQNKLLMIDPNIRTSFIRDETSYRQRIERMTSMADVVKVSDEDLTWLANEQDEQALVDTWLSNNASLVLITKGSEGVTAWTKNGSFDEPAQPANIVDTIGAGDTFIAGFFSGLRIAGLLNKLALQNATHADLQPALYRAAKVASITVSKAGADGPWKNEVDG